MNGSLNGSVQGLEARLQPPCYVPLLGLSPDHLQQLYIMLIRYMYTTGDDIKIRLCHARGKHSSFECELSVNMQA